MAVGEAMIRRQGNHVLLVGIEHCGRITRLLLISNVRIELIEMDYGYMEYGEIDFPLKWILIKRYSFIVNVLFGGFPWLASLSTKERKKKVFSLDGTVRKHLSLSLAVFS